MQPYIVQSALDARRADLVRQADAARLAARSGRRRRLRVSWLRERVATVGFGFRRTSRGRLTEEGVR